MLGAREALGNGHPYVYDADLRRHHFTQQATGLGGPSHHRRHILRWIKEWLKVVVVEEDEQGRRRTMGGKKAKRGTPQGGVISPLLANIYLHLFDGCFFRIGELADSAWRG